jgi:predicted dehydrogenase
VVISSQQTNEETSVALRIIQVGIADWGATWAAVVQRSPEAVLVARVNLNPAAGDPSQTDRGTAQGFTSLEEALAVVEADAVLITAGAAACVSLALTALAAGKHLLIEQPFSATLAEAKRILAAADAAGRVLMVSQNYRFYPAPRTVAALVRGNVLGAIGSISIDFRQNIALLPPEHALSQITQPLLAEIAVHHFDLLRMILGDEAAQVSCQTWNPPWSLLSGPAAAAATITCVNGTIITYRGNWASHASPTAWAGAWRIECADGEIAWTSRNGQDASADTVIVRRRGETARRVALPALRQIDRDGCLAAFVRAIRTGQPPESSGRDQLGTIALTQSAITAARTGQTVLLPLPPISLPWPSRAAAWLSRIRANSTSDLA